MPTGQSSAAPRKPSAKPRPVLSSHVAHAHAFAAVPTPGNPASARSTTSYFPLPTPPAPLRSFTLPQNDSAKMTDGGDTNTYPTSVASTSQRDALVRASEKRVKEARTTVSAPEHVERKSARRSSRAADSSSKAHTHSSASISGMGAFQFATAAPFGINAGSNSYIPSPGVHSARSALSIAEIDCFFVQGSRSSTYSAYSPRSQPVTGSTGRSDQSAEPTLSSNDELGEGGSSDMWLSDQAERERRRAERQAFMKARKEAREELRKQRRLAKVGAADGLSAEAQSDWRQAIRSHGTIPLNDVPLSRESIRERKRANTAASERAIKGNIPNQPLVLASHIAPTTAAPPSGPGPPDRAPSESTSADTLANDLTTNLSLSTQPSEILENSPEDSTEQTPADQPQTAPVLNRFDSDETEVGSSTRQPEPPAEP
ncbi:hypothetical protein RhiJN_07162 [Ceratobasidium sp. AG-Ba]|nr:hypothetical protein RhiJN_07162 [Ceratobasidium sp. AG-Ba]